MPSPPGAGLELSILLFQLPSFATMPGIPQNFVSEIIY